MNKIYRVAWYNENAYGWQDHICVIVQGKDLKQSEARDKAMKYLRNLYPMIDFSKFEHLEIAEKTDNELLSIEIGIV